MSEANSSGNGNLRLFIGCFIALVATAFGFIVRAGLLNEWRVEFKLSNEEVGYIGGAGLYPFAISIILFSLIIDKIGYGRAMVFAFVGHAASAVMTIFATSFEMLYLATFIFALANGVVEAVINPVVATMYDKNKTHWLNILHAGWPGGLVFGGLLAIGVSFIPAGTLPGDLWRWQMGLLLIPTLIYGVLLLGQRFPVQERVAAGVTYRDMLKEFGWGSSYIVFFLLIAGVNQILLVAGVPSLSLWVIAGIAIVPTLLFAVAITDSASDAPGGLAYQASFGRPMFVFLLLIMFLLATTELGTDNWMPDIVGSILASPTSGTLFLVYTSFIMFVLRFFAGPIVHRISPLGLLLVSALLASGGLLWLSAAGAAVGALFLAATVYGFGKTFFWPTTLGVVSERFPKGGALMLNAIAGVGMLAVGTIGSPTIGTVQDMAFDEVMQEKHPTLYRQVVQKKPGMFGEYNSLDQKKRDVLELGATSEAVLKKLSEPGEAPDAKKEIEDVLASIGVLKSSYEEAARTEVGAKKGGNLAQEVVTEVLVQKRVDEEYGQSLAQLSSLEGLLLGVKKSNFSADAIAKAQTKADELAKDANTVKEVVAQTKQSTLGKIAILPAIMFFCYFGLIVYFRSRGGYQQEVLVGHAAEDEAFTGGVEGPVE